MDYEAQNTLEGKERTNFPRRFLRLFRSDAALFPTHTVSEVETSAEADIGSPSSGMHTLLTVSVVSATAATGRY